MKEAILFNKGLVISSFVTVSYAPFAFILKSSAFF